ncbi:MAG: GyrI-like domain-containing protein [Chitinophagaceae bacterium]
MEYRLATIDSKKLVGKHLTMSFTNNRTGELWRSFMPERKLIANKVGSELYSMQLYAEDHFKNFDPAATFEKWAAVEVTDHSTVPPGMETFILPGGLYAVFLYKGLPAEGAKAFQYILGTWLPVSGYVLDSRPHYELLGEKYKNDSPDSEEEIWIPVKPVK